jgi:uncharacterized protein (TIGR02300 family)
MNGRTFGGPGARKGAISSILLFVLRSGVFNAGSFAENREDHGNANLEGGAKSMYGKKYTCPECGCKFYDLNRPQAICPKCGIEYKERAKTAGEKAPARRRKKIPPPIEVADELLPPEEKIDEEFPGTDDFSPLSETESEELGEETDEEEPYDEE